MVPNLITLPGAPWRVLPPGIHPVSLSEIETEFATNSARRQLFQGLKQAAQSLAQAKVRYLFLDGSFVTEKPIPGDYDACWDPTGVEVSLLDPVFRTFDNKRAAQKSKYFGEFFPFNAYAGAGKSFLEFFATEKVTGQKKGILLIDLQDEFPEVSKETQT